ncbi:MAG: DNA topoisomerase [Oscillospiraceae bacterium]
MQSVATRLVVDRENEIRAFVPQEYWTLDVNLNRAGKPGSFTAHYYGDPQKRELTSEQDVQSVLDALEGQPFSVTGVKKSEKKRTPAPPFITSTLQQEASRKLNMTPRRTMMIAQQLYEGVEISGEGSVGLITYMRTDSLRISEEALAAAGDAIRSRYGAAYYAEPRRYKPKSGAQDAHEAIRPSNVALYPEAVEHDLTKEQYRLYKLIWSRFIASQMTNALYDVTAIEATCGSHVFRATHQSMKFSALPPFMRKAATTSRKSSIPRCPTLPPARRSRPPALTSSSTSPSRPHAIREASLVRAMEEKGVGRPSTYAAIIATIQDREYVIKTDKKLSPTKLGEVVNGLMMDRFPNIISVEFTADMEKQLDQVEAGQSRWKSVLEEFYTGFHQEMVDAEEALKDTRLKVPDEVSDEKCEICGRNLVVKTSRFGKFLACPGYPDCKFTKPITEKMPGSCPQLRQHDSQAQEQARLCLLCLRTRRGVRLCDVGRASRRIRLPGLRADDVQALRQRCDEAVLRQPRVLELPARGKARLPPKVLRPAASRNCRIQRRAAAVNLPPEAGGGAMKARETTTAAKKPAAKKAAAKKPAAKKAASAKTAAAKEAG